MICEQNYRRCSKSLNKAPWVRILASSEYQLGPAERYKIDHKCIGVKRWYGFGRYRCSGLQPYGIQAFTTTAALNVKRTAYLMAGIRFCPQQPGPRPAVGT